ncbi:MAG TPA: hypothetical protein QGH10_15205, partial [Armatimonadota bacterium]|nr:hypothetical protein [Armatimonadota bacterium]
PNRAFSTALAARLGGVARSDSQFLTNRIDLPDGGHIDVASARQEAYAAPANLPTVESASIGDDLRRRDFSVNAMALHLALREPYDLVDPCGGADDLHRGRLRVLHDRSFTDDPTRIIRAARLAARLGFVIEPQTRTGMRLAVDADMLRLVTGSRIRAEVAKLLEEPDPSQAVRHLDEIGAMTQAMPGACSGPHSLRWLQQTPVALAALGIAGTRARPQAWPYLLGAVCAQGRPTACADRLTLDRRARDIVLSMGDARPTDLTQQLASRERLDDARLDACLHAARPGHMVRLWLGGGPVLRRRLERYNSVVQGTQADVTGHDLADAGIPAGPAVRIGLQGARRAKLAGQTQVDMQLRAAVRAIRRWQRPGAVGR